SGEPRILSICDDYITHVDGGMEEQSFLAYIQYYQEISTLSIAEVWAFPLAMRLILFRQLAMTMVTIQERRDICMKVEQWLGKIEPTTLSPEVITNALEEAGQEIPFS